MDRDSNMYTFLFSAVMVLIVAASLAATATSLQDIQAENVRKEKMQNILATIGIIVEREKAPEIYTKYIIEELALISDGSIDKKVDAFKLKLNLETKKPIKQQRFPLYLAKVDSLQYYIVPSPCYQFYSFLSSTSLYGYSESMRRQNSHSHKLRLDNISNFQTYK